MKMLLKFFFGILVAALIFLSYSRGKIFLETKRQLEKIKQSSSEKSFQEILRTDKKTLSLKETRKKLEERIQVSQRDLLGQEENFQESHKELELMKQRIQKLQERLDGVERKISSLQEKYPSSNFSVGGVANQTERMEQRIIKEENQTKNLKEKKQLLEKEISEGRETQKKLHSEWRNLVNSLDLAGTSYTVKEAQSAWDFFVIDFGKDAKRIKKGSSLVIYRGDEFIGTAQILEVKEFDGIASPHPSSSLISAGDQVFLSE